MWKKVLKNKIILVLCLGITLLLMSACAASNINDFYIRTVIEIDLSMGDFYNFDDKYQSNNEEVFSIDDNNIGKAISLGDASIYKNNENNVYYLVHVTNMPKYIDAECDNILKVGEESELNVVVSPLNASQDVEYEISDPSIIKIEDNKIIALKEGYCDLKIKSISKQSIETSVSILVQNEDETSYEDKVEFNIHNNSTVPTYENIGEELNGLIKNVEKSFVGINQYTNSVISDFGGGLLYKRNAYLNDGTKIDDITIDKLDNVKYFEYYLITTRNFGIIGDRYTVYLGEAFPTYNATMIQYDPKVDLCLFKFECPLYLPLIKFGDSDDINQGEFIISINNSNGINYFRTVTYGIISHTKRYVATDTDGDETSDWDSEFIQHDASVNSEAAKKVVYTSGDIYNYINGGALINLKGELIGLDSMKISALDSTINNMSLSIPSNLILEILKMLEKGEQPQRPLLGVTILDLSNYYKNKDYYDELYGDMNVPDGLEYGFYISEVVDGGVAAMANVQKGDILIKFNDSITKYSYQLRAELGKFIIGSGQTATLTVIRAGEEVTLTVTF